MDATAGVIHSQPRAEERVSSFNNLMVLQLDMSFGGHVGTNDSLILQENMYCAFDLTEYLIFTDLG